MAECYITAEEAAEYLKVSVGTLAVWRSTQRYTLPFHKVGRCVRYLKSEIDKWLNEKED